MHDDAMTSNDPGFADIARRLEAFSDLRLTPSAETAARMRAEVMSVAYRRTAGASLRSGRRARGAAFDRFVRRAAPEIGERVRLAPSVRGRGRGGIGARGDDRDDLRRPGRRTAV